MAQSITSQDSTANGYDPLSYPSTEGRSGWVSTLHLIWTERRFVVHVTLIGMILATALAFLIPQQFQSTARLMPPDSQQSGLAAAIAGEAMGGSGLPGGLLSLLSGGSGSGATFVGVLQSRTAADAVIQKFDLLHVYGVRRMEDARKILATKTVITQDRKSGIIDITVTDHQPDRAAGMAEAYVEELDRLVSKLSTSAARRQREFLEQRLKVVKKELEDSQVALSQFSSKNTTLDIKDQGRTMVEAAATLQGQLIAAQTELQGLRQIYTDENVRVRAVEARIAEYRRQLDRLSGAADDTSTDGTSGAMIYPSIRKLPILGVQYADLYRRTRTAEVVYELLTRQYEIARIDEAKEIPTVRELDVPVVPQRKSFPPRALIMLFGTAFAFCCASAWLLGKEMWSRVDPADPRKQLAGEIFGTTKVTVRSAQASVRDLGWIRRMKKQRNQDPGTE